MQILAALKHKGTKAIFIACLAAFIYLFFSKSISFQITVSCSESAVIAVIFAYVGEFDYTSDINILAIEYPGYGINKPIEPTFNNIEKTAGKAYEYLRNMGIEPKDINIMGYCFGSTIATKLASKVDCHSLTLISPVTSFSQISSGYLNSKKVKLTTFEKIQNFIMAKFGTKPKLHDKLNAYQYIDSVKCPIFVMSSNEDPVTDLKWIDHFVKYISSRGKNHTYIKGLDEGHKISILKSKILSIIANHDNLPAI